ncbi:MAG TPA: WD40 repeat domain-containing protein [Verrucomicrobiae bacterium]|nr:WD40 repeat domain-containing protein [Verrucomicrobiae bacterium]
MKLKLLHLHEEPYYEDNSWVEAAYFNEKDKQIWFDTLEDIRPDVPPSTLTNDGKNLITNDSYGCGLVFYEVLPLPKYLGTTDCFDAGWEFLEQEGLVFGLNATTAALYKQDGALLWEKPPSPDSVELYDPKFSISKNEEAILVGWYDGFLEEAWLRLFTLDGEERGRVKFSTELFFTGYLRSIFVSSLIRPYAIAVSDGALVCFDMKSRQELWDYKYRNPNWWIGGLDFSPDGRTMAAVISHWDPKEEKPHIQLFDTKTGILQGNYVNLEDSMKLWRETSKIEFTKDGKYLIAATPKRKYLFRVNYEK